MELDQQPSTKHASSTPSVETIQLCIKIQRTTLPIGRLLGTRARRTDTNRRRSSPSASNERAPTNIHAIPAGRAQEQKSIQRCRPTESFREKITKVERGSERPPENHVEPREPGRILQICQVNEQSAFLHGRYPWLLQCVEVDRQPRAEVWRSRKRAGGHRHRAQRATEMMTIE